MYFRVASRKIQGYMVNQRGIEANSDKIKALVKMRSPQKSKEAQNLTGQVAALSRFVSKVTNNYIPFFSPKRGNHFQWTQKCEEQVLKKYLGQAFILSKPKNGKPLLLYLVMTTEPVSSVLL